MQGEIYSPLQTKIFRIKAWSRRTEDAVILKALGKRNRKNTWKALKCANNIWVPKYA